MRVRCSARADYRSNAVGELELECSPSGLHIALSGVSTHREGYAPGPLIHAGDVCVPWPSVYATRLGDRQLLLSVDARNLPYNRFLLAEFSERSPDEAAGVMHRRALPYAFASAGLVALSVCLAQARALPHARAIGTLGWAVLVVSLALALIAWRARRAPRPPAHVVLDDLCDELARYVPHHISRAAPTPAPRNFEPVAWATLLPRSAVAIAITLAAATLAALVGAGATRPRARPSEPASPAPDPPSAAATAVSSRAAPVAADDCTCAREQSLHWQRPLPRLRPLLLSERRRTHDGHEHLELELALVNDGNTPARELTLSVVFFETRAGARPGHFETGERDLFFERTLAPGEAAEWHVEGRGTSFDVIPPDFGTLAADGSDAAPADAFARLANDRARAIRLHAAELLVFLDDARAGSTVSALRSSASPAELDFLDRLVQPPAPLVACQLDVVREPNGWRLGACAFNRSDQPASALNLRWLTFDAAMDPLRPGQRAPVLLREHAAHVPTPLPARGGRRLELTSLSLDGPSPPRAFELRLERAEVLP